MATFFKSLLRESQRRANNSAVIRRRSGYEAPYSSSRMTPDYNNNLSLDSNVATEGSAQPNISSSQLKFNEIHAAGNAQIDQFEDSYQSDINDKNSTNNQVGASEPEKHTFLHDEIRETLHYSYTHTPNEDLTEYGDISEPGNININAPDKKIKIESEGVPDSLMSVVGHEQLSINDQNENNGRNNNQIKNDEKSPSRNSPELDAEFAENIDAVTLTNDAELNSVVIKESNSEWSNDFSGISYENVEIKKDDTFATSINNDNNHDSQNNDYMPRLHIGHIDIVIQVQKQTNVQPSMSEGSLDSLLKRHYLRGI